MRQSLFLLSFILLLVSTNLAGQEIIAHRGYWKTGGSAQNSIAALVKADSIGIFGSEVDVWLS
ncbi:MAG: glycerophosphodiester phosphodiesterase, partial [Proteiniphilum sp.]